MVIQQPLKGLLLWHPQSNAKRGGDDRSGSASADLACRPCARCRLMSHPKQAAARAAPTHRASRALQLSCVSSTLPWVPERCYHCNAGRGAERAAAVRRVCAAGAARRRARRGRALPGRRVGAGAPAAAPERSGAGRPRRGPRQRAVRAARAAQPPSRARGRRRARGPHARRSHAAARRAPCA